MNLWTLIGLLVIALAPVHAQETAVPNIADFMEVNGGAYQVFAQSGPRRGLEVNSFMNEMLRQYSKYFANWTAKAGARVVVFDNSDDFKLYTHSATKLSSDNVTGYCQLKTDAERRHVL